MTTNIPASDREVTTTDNALPVLTVAEQHSIGEAQLMKAERLAAKIGDKLTPLFTAASEAEETKRLTVFYVMDTLAKEYTDEELAELPEPDSELGNNPDKIKLPVIKDGKTTSKDTTFYILFADDTSFGRQILTEMEWCTKLADQNQNHEDIPEEFKSKYYNPELRKARMEYLSGRRSTVRQAVKSAADLLYKMSQAEQVPGFGFKVLYEDKEKTKVMNTRKPIKIWNTDNPDIYDYVSPSQFKSYKFAIAVEKGGTYQNVLDTVKKAPRTAGSGQGQQPETVKLPMIKTVGTFFDRQAEIESWLDEVFQAKDNRDYQEIIKQLNSPGSDEMLSSIVRVRDMFNDFLKHVHNLNARREVIEQALKAA